MVEPREMVNQTKSMELQEASRATTGVAIGSHGHCQHRVDVPLDLWHFPQIVIFLAA
jgi:hypothetical protein